MIRPIIKIDENLCNGCGLCIPDCPEGALQVIDGKARLVSDLFCDGLGACMGRCPEGAIQVETREASPYDEKTVMLENILPKGKNTLLAHLRHLLHHGADEYLLQAESVLRTSGVAGSEAILKDWEEEKRDISNKKVPAGEGMSKKVSETSELTHWPIQLHLINPQAEHFFKADLLIAADCTAFSFANFHGEFLSGKKMVIACPKLDQATDVYISKIAALINQGAVNTITVVIMEVPCCGGLNYLVTKAQESATRKVPVRQIILSIKGETLRDQWL